MFNVTVYYVGESKEEAAHGLPFDCQESAENFQYDNGGNIYEVTLSFKSWELKEVK